MITITLFGCGAIGSQLALHLASADVRFILVDDDRVAEENLATSAFQQAQVGVNKDLALGILLYRKNKCAADCHHITANNNNWGKLVEKSDLALDCFDNADARLITCHLIIPTLHVGVSREGTGSITWDIHYEPLEGAPRGQDAFCTHLAGRGIIRLTAAVAARVVEIWRDTGRKESYIVTENLKVIKIGG